MSTPPKLGATAQLKKFTKTMHMVQRVRRMREVLMTALTDLDIIDRFFLEQLDLTPEDLPPPSVKGPTSPSDMPTSFNPIWNDAAFEKHMLSSYAQATTEQDRENVRTLVGRGVTSKLITQDQAKDILAKMK